jgi:predicted RND superfamily exporter protein
MVGFCSLLVSPIGLLRTLGAMLVLGIAFAAGAALFFLPSLLAACSRPRPGHAREKHIRSFLPHVPRRGASIVLIAVVSFLAAGIPMIRQDYRLGIFRAGSAVGRTIGYFHERNGGIDELELVLDSQAQYGLIDLDLFKRLKSVCRAVERSPDVSQVIAFTDFVEWANAGLNAQDEPLEPQSDEVIGETLELISSGGTGLGIDRLIDPAYRRTRILIRFGISALTAGGSARRLNRIRSDVRALMSNELPDVEYHLLGYALEIERMLLYLVRGLVLGLALFFPLLILFLLFVLGSLRWALITMIPTVSAVILYLGTMGWFRIPLSCATAFSAAIVLGVSVDDVLYFVLFYRQQSALLGMKEALPPTQKKAGVATIQTTAIIVAALCVLLFSVYTVIMHSAIVAATALCFATAVTLLVVPSLLVRTGRPPRGGTP